MYDSNFHVTLNTIQTADITSRPAPPDDANIKGDVCADKAAAVYGQHDVERPRTAWPVTIALTV